MSVEALLKGFAEIAESPKAQLDKYKAQGKKAIGVLPYYAPEELVYAAGMVPFGIWGCNDKTISRAKEYCASFYCSIAQLALELLMDGSLDGLDGLITPTICDTLRPMSQNFRVAAGDKMPVIFLAHPQNRAGENGLRFCMSQYESVRARLEGIAGAVITQDKLRGAIGVYNAARALSRRFVALAAEHADVVSPTSRSQVLKAAWFTLKDEYAAKLGELNDALEKLPVCDWRGSKVVTSGIVCDSPKLLAIFEESGIAIAADDVAQESRSFRVDAPDDPDPMRALARRFADVDCDVLLYDRESAKNLRGEFVARLVKESGADGLVLFMQQFCDPEEMEYPSLKKALDAAGIPHIKLGVDQQMRDFGQAATAIQAFADVLRGF